MFVLLRVCPQWLIRFRAGRSTGLFMFNPCHVLDCVVFRSEDGVLLVIKCENSQVTNSVVDSSFEHNKKLICLRYKIRNYYENKKSLYYPDESFSIAEMNENYLKLLKSLIYL